MSCCLRLPPPLAPPPRVVVEVLEEAWAISSNLGNWGMAAEDGPCLSRRSVPLRSMFDPSRHRRWPHRGGSLLLANPPQSAPRGWARASLGAPYWGVPCTRPRRIRGAEMGGLPQPGSGDQDRLEAHNERAAIIVDGRPDSFEQTVSDHRLEGGVVAIRQKQ